ncbi:MAG: hypothetical protein SVY53_12975 [Chloroflexota bacterium]|nr:hypothetical protein [Chloroflexota bacterium]
MKRLKLLVPLVTVLALCMMFAAPVLADQHCDTCPPSDHEPCGGIQYRTCEIPCITPGAVLAVMTHMVTAKIDYIATKIMEDPHYQAAKAVAHSTGHGMVVGGMVAGADPVEGMVAGIDPVEGMVAGIDPIEGMVAGMDPVEGMIAGIDPVEGMIAGIDPVEGMIAGIDPIEGMIEAIDITGGVLGTLLGIPLPGPAVFWGLVGGLDPVAGLIDMIDPMEGMVAAIDPVEGMVAAIDPVEGMVAAIDPMEGMVAAIDPVEGMVAAIDPMEGMVAAIDPVEGMIGAYHGAVMGMGLGLGIELVNSPHIASSCYVACETCEAEVSSMACAAVDQACDIST